MKSIRRQYLKMEYIFLLVILGVPALFFLLIAKPYCIQKSSNEINSIFDNIQTFDLDSMSEENYEYLKSCENGGMQIAIGCSEDGQVEVLYGTSFGNQHNFASKHYKRKLEQSPTKYVYNAEALYSQKGNAVLRGLVNQHGTEYFVYIKQPLRILTNTLNYLTVAFLVVVVVALLVSGVLIAVLSKKLTRLIYNVGRIANKIANLDFSEKMKVDSGLSEIDDLSESINKMSVRIQRYLSELENYNYCLREENYSISKLEYQRDACVNGISHELKTPLAIMSSQLAIIQDMPDNPKKDYYFNSINEEIEKMSGLISKLLNNSFDLDSYNGRLMPVNLSNIMNDILKKYEYLFDNEGLFCYSDIEENCYIDADSEYLEMAIHNYITNAAEHTKENGVVQINLSREGNRAVISVYNQGENIPEDIIESIWNRYFRQTKVEYNEQGNIGMGLSIVKSVVNIHQGKCYVKNNEDGVTFFMEFDLSEENDDYDYEGN